MNTKAGLKQFEAFLVDKKPVRFKEHALPVIEQIVRESNNPKAMTKALIHRWREYKAEQRRIYRGRYYSQHRNKWTRSGGYNDQAKNRVNRDRSKTRLSIIKRMTLPKRAYTAHDLQDLPPDKLGRVINQITRGTSTFSLQVRG